MNFIQFFLLKKRIVCSESLLEFVNQVSKNIKPYRSTLALCTQPLWNHAGESSSLKALSVIEILYLITLKKMWHYPLSRLIKFLKQRLRYITSVLEFRIINFLVFVCLTFIHGRWAQSKRWLYPVLSLPRVTDNAFILGRKESTSSTLQVLHIVKKNKCTKLELRSILFTKLIFTITYRLFTRKLNVIW